MLHLPLFIFLFGLLGFVPFWRWASRLSVRNLSNQGDDPLDGLGLPCEEIASMPLPVAIEKGPDNNLPPFGIVSTYQQIADSLFHSQERQDD